MCAPGNVHQNLCGCRPTAPQQFRRFQQIVWPLGAVCILLSKTLEPCLSTCQHIRGAGCRRLSHTRATSFLRILDSYPLKGGDIATDTTDTKDTLQRFTQKNANSSQLQLSTCYTYPERVVGAHLTTSCLQTRDSYGDSRFNHGLVSYAPMNLKGGDSR